MNSHFNPKPCVTCGEIIIPTSGSQKYCLDCSKKAFKKSLSKYGKKETTRKRKSIQREFLIKAGERIDAEQEGLHWDAITSSGVPSDLKVVIKVPFTSDLSKNKLFNGYRKGGGVFTPSGVKKAKQSIVDALKKSCQDIKFKDNKTYISIFIAKDSNRVDAVNLVDSIMDAIQDGIGVNDRWYAIKKLDWSVSRHNPFILIGIEQEQKDMQVCQYCNRILEIKNFYKNNSKKNGVLSYCKDCYNLASELYKNSIDGV